MATGSDTAPGSTGIPTIPTLKRKLMIENIGIETTIEELTKCFHPALQQCASKTRPELQLAVDKKGRSLGCAWIVVPISKIDVFLNFDGWYINKHQMKVSIDDSHDVTSTWQTKQKGVFTTSPPRVTESHRPSHLYSIIDGGVYLTHPSFKTPEDVIVAATNCGVEKLVSFGTSVYHSQEGLKLARLFSGTVFCTAGVSPRNAVYWTDETEQQLEDVARCPECVAVGICGFNLGTDELIRTCDQQLLAFEKQIQLAVRLGKPVVVSDDKASTEVMSMLSKYKGQLSRVAILGRPVEQDLFTQYLEEGFYYYITGGILETDPPSVDRRLMKNGQQNQYLHQFLLASHAPYRFGVKTPPGKPLPSLLPEVVATVAQLMQLEKEEVTKTLKDNAETFYGQMSSSRSAEADDTERLVSQKESLNAMAEKDSEVSQFVLESASPEKESNSEVERVKTVGEDRPGQNEDRSDSENGIKSNQETENRLCKNDQNGSDKDTATMSVDSHSCKATSEEASHQLDSTEDQSGVRSDSSAARSEKQAYVTVGEDVSEMSGAEHHGKATDKHAKQTHVTPEAEDSPGKAVRDSGSYVSTSGQKTDWVYRIVLWLAFIMGLIAMYYYKD